MNFVQDVLGGLNELLRPIAEALNAPVLVVGGAISGVVAAIVGGLFSAARSKRQDKAIDELKKLTNRQTELIELALAASADKLPQSSQSVVGGDPRAALRAALQDYVTSDDPRGQEVIELVTKRRNSEAQKLAFEIASDAQEEAQRLTTQAQLKAARKWRDAGSIAYLNDPTSAVIALERARTLDPTHIQTSLLLGQVYRRLGRLNDAENVYRETEAYIPPSDQNSLGALLGSRGLLALTRGDDAVAEPLLTRALKVYESLKDKRGMAAALGNLGLAARQRDNLAAAEEFHTRSFKLAEEIGARKVMAHQLSNLGVVAKERKDYEEAERRHSQALALSESEGDLETVAAQLTNLGIVARCLDKLDVSEDFHNRALKLNQKLGIREGQATDLANLGSVAKDRGDLQTACARWTQAREIFVSIGAKAKAGVVDSWMRENGCV